MNKAYAVFARAVLNTVWCIEPATLAAIMAKAQNLTDEQAKALIDEAGEMLTARAIHGGTIRAVAAKTGSAAIVPVQGILSPTRGSLYDEIFGMPKTNPATVADMVEAAVADPDVKVVVMIVDCPGGNCIGIPEAAARIMAARGKKPIIAVVSGVCASGGYWLAASADEIVAGQAAMIGSLGVFREFQGYVGLNEQMGIVEEYIASVPDKVEAMGNVPLSDEARAHILDQVMTLDKMFMRDISAGRGQNMDQDGRGRTYVGPSAKARGLIDGLDTLAAVLARYNAPVQTQERGSVSNSARGRHLALATARAASIDHKA